MARRYRHTQFGWAIVTSTLLPIGILGSVALASRSFAPLLGLIPLLVIVPVFASLTVAVTDAAVLLRFGVGLIRKRFPLDDIESAAPVTNSWISGWGIRLIPGGWLYNVSGTDAVELRLRNGRTVRVGTDDQEALLAALSEARATVLPSMPPETSPMLGYTMAGPIIVVVLCGVAMVGILMFGMRPIQVDASSADVSIRASGYSARIPATDIVSVHLDAQLPDIGRRTNGFAFSGRLRGHFRLSDGRPARLFVTRSHPPFLTLETRKEPIIINFDEPERTRALYEQLSARF